jgi:hypothetical protein
MEFVPYPRLRAARRNPEGVIVYHSAARQSFKVLLENDHLPKGAAG